MKVNFILGLFILSSALFVTSCAHHRDVRPGADGIHRVVINAEDTQGGAQEAIEQANHFCKERNQYAAIVKEDNKYVGDIKEENYKTGKKISKVAEVIGSAGYVFGGKKERTAGGIVGIGGAATDAALGKGYSVDMKFKCM